MKAVILAGGLGTRLTEETYVRPKPMIEIGGRPLLWHIMKCYSAFGIHDFIICCGYKGYVIKEYFANYFLHTSDLTIDVANNEVEIHSRHAEPWKITLVDTGDNTMTGGRLKRIRSFIASDESFCCTYGDGLSDVNIAQVIAFHHHHGKHATLTATVPAARFGALDIEQHQVKQFVEKPVGEGGLINGGFFVFSPAVLDLIAGDDTVLEQYPLQQLARSGQLMAYEHLGFWQPMDTLREKNQLEQLWQQGQAPWTRAW